MLHRQKVSQKLDGQTIRQERGPPNFLTEQFWRTAFREQSSDRTPTALLLRLTGAGIEARTLEGQFAKEGSQADLVVTLTSQRLLAVRTLALLFHILLDLALGHDLLDASSCLASSIQL